MIYHAYGFPCPGYDPAHVRSVIEWARAHKREIRTWVRDESGMLILAVADPDPSVDARSDLYEHVKAHAPSYECYELASRHEFEVGAPVPVSAELIVADKLLINVYDEIHVAPQYSYSLELLGEMIERGLA